MSDDKPPSGKSIEIITALLWVVAAVLAILGSTITNNPQLILPLLVIIGVGAAVVVLVAGVWDNISDRLSYRFSRSIEYSLDRPRRKQFRSAYLKYLYHSHRTFDVKGLTTQGIYALELEQIFVDLSIAPDANLPENPIPPELTTGGIPYGSI